MRISDWSSDVCSSDLPVEHDVRDKLFKRNGLGNVAPAIAPGRKLLEDPGRQTHRRIGKGRRDGIRLCPLQDEISGPCFAEFLVAFGCLGALWRVGIGDVGVQRCDGAAVPLSDATPDDAAPVSALYAVTAVSDSRHQRLECRRY